MVSCVVPGCRSRNRGCKFHRLPVRNKSTIELWLEACPFLRKYTFQQLCNVRICYLHFESKYVTGTTNRLIDSAIPTLNLIKQENKVTDLSNISPCATVPFNLPNSSSSTPQPPDLSTTSASPVNQTLPDRSSSSPSPTSSHQLFLPHISIDSTPYHLSLTPIGCQAQSSVKNFKTSQSRFFESQSVGKSYSVDETNSDDEHDSVDEPIYVDVPMSDDASLTDDKPLSDDDPMTDDDPLSDDEVLSDEESLWNNKSTSDYEPFSDDKSISGDKHLTNDKHLPNDKPLSDHKHMSNVKSFSDDKHLPNNKVIYDDNLLSNDKPLLSDKPVPDDKPYIKSSQSPNDVQVAENTRIDPENTECIAIITTASTAHLTPEQGNWLVKTLENRIIIEARLKIGKGPNFTKKHIYEEGKIKLWCSDSNALGWLKNVICDITLPSGECLVMVRETDEKKPDICKHVRCSLLIPGRLGIVYKDVAKILLHQNPWALVNKWVFYAVMPQQGNILLLASIPKELVPIILAHECSLGYLLGSVNVYFQSKNGRFIEITCNENEVKGAELTQLTGISKQNDETN